MKNIYSSLPNLTALAEQISTKISGGEVFALIGPLGSGKATLVKHIAKALHVKERVTSPTFTLMKTYAGNSRAMKKKLSVYHLDLYRISDPAEAIHSGLTENWGKANTVTFIEWADKALALLPKNTIYIYLHA